MNGETKRKAFFVEVPEATHRAIRLLSAERGESMSNIIREWIERELAQIGAASGASAATATTDAG